MKLLARLSVASSILLSACGAPPTKPTVELCTIDAKAVECICGMTANPGSDVKRYPISYCDKATAARPAEWEKIQNYIHEMEEYIRSGLKAYKGSGK